MRKLRPAVFPALILLAACAQQAAQRREPNPLEAPPIDASVAANVDALKSWKTWPYVRESAGDLNSNGEIDSVRLIADPERNAWAVYASDGIAPTLLYAAVVPNGGVDVGLTDAGANGAPHVVVAERTRRRLRVMEIAVDGDGRARLVSEGNYHLTGWLQEPAPPPISR